MVFLVENIEGLGLVVDKGNNGPGQDEVRQIIR